MIYEDRFDTKVADFGCMKHFKHDFIGASPDGIKTDITNLCQIHENTLKYVTFGVTQIFKYLQILVLETQFSSGFFQIE